LINLLINTATELKEIIIYGNNTFATTSYTGEKNDLDNLLPNLKSLLETNKIEIQDLESIVAVSGPGSFTALRIGVCLANTLATELKIPLYEISTAKYIKARLNIDPIDFYLLKAGADQIHIFGGNFEHMGIQQLNKFIEQNQDKKLVIAGDFTEKLEKIWQEQKDKIHNFTFYNHQDWQKVPFLDDAINSSIELCHGIIAPNYFKEPICL
jgi:tRNA threonylcarbamoyl adenosine modification protein YeaZ